MKLIPFLVCLISWTNCFAQNENIQNAKQRYVMYEDTGFCFVSGPHNLCTFIGSTELSLEAAILKNKRQQPFQYIFILGDTFNDYFNVDFTLSDTINRHRSSIKYHFGHDSFDSIQYYRVAVRITIPIEDFCYKPITQKDYGEYALRYKGKTTKLYSLISKGYLFFDCVDFKIL